MTPAKKALKDLALRKARSLFTIAGLVIGLWGIGSALVAYAVLSKDLRENFLKTRPPTLVLDIGGLPPTVLETIRGLDDLLDVENRPLLHGRFSTEPDRWLPLQLFVVDDFSDLSVARFEPHRGSFPPPDGSILIERSGQVLLRFASSEPESRHGPAHPSEAKRAPTRTGEVRIQLPGGTRVTAPLSGTVFDPGLAPSNMELMFYGYVTRSTAERWMPGGIDDRLLIRTTPGTDKVDLAKKIEELVLDSGKEVKGIRLLAGDQHPHQFQMTSILVVLGGLGLVALLMSAVLVSHQINNLLSQQIRQMGALKAIGARRIQLIVMYGSSMWALGLIASVIAWPLSYHSGFVVARVISSVLNFEIFADALSVGHAVFFVAAGSLFPVAAALPPILRATRISVRDALEDFGTRPDQPSALARLELPIPVLIRAGLRNGLRVPGRTFRAALAAAVGALAFMVAMNLRASLLYTASVEERTMLHDIRVNFAGEVTRDRIRWMQLFDEVERVELWPASRANWLDPATGMLEGYALIGVPQDTQLFTPHLVEGRWLSKDLPSHEFEAVANHRFMAQHPTLQTGRSVTLSVDGKPLSVRIVGMTKSFGPAVLYIAAKTLRSHRGSTGETGRLALVQLVAPSEEARNRVMALLEQHYELAGITVRDLQASKIASLIIRNHLDVIVLMLNVAAGAMLLVSGLGMAAGIATSVVERTRELGVLRAIGATPRAIFTVLATESIFVSLLGWGAGVILAAPLSQFLAHTFGTSIVEYPFDYQTSFVGIVLALSVIGVALLATLGPARAINRQEVHDAVSYE